jgi:hypothetical protein
MNKIVFALEEFTGVGLLLDKTQETNTYKRKTSSWQYKRHDGPTKFYEYA